MLNDSYTPTPEYISPVQQSGVFKTVPLKKVTPLPNRRKRQGRTAANLESQNRVHTGHQKRLDDLIARLPRCTHFSASEVARLSRIYSKMMSTNTKTDEPACHTCEGKEMDRIVFRNVMLQTFNITDDLMMDRIFKVFDTAKDQLISLEEWVRGLSVFIRGTQTELFKFKSFEVYDLRSDGAIHRESVFQLLKDSIVTAATPDEKEDLTKDLVDMVFAKMDLDRDGIITFQDYIESVSAEPLLVEAFGHCLPDATIKLDFENLFGDAARMMDQY